MSVIMKDKLRGKVGKVDEVGRKKRRRWKRSRIGYKHKG